MADTEFIVIEGNAQEVFEQEEEVVAHSDNLALHIDERELEEVAHQVYQKYQDDKDSRQDWEQMFEKGFELLGLKLKETSEPFEGACTAVHPLIIENAVKFQSKASQELLPPKGPVKTQIIGKVTPDKEAQAKRVKEFMNYEISEMMPEYFDEFERLLFQLPIFGSAFKKVYYDAAASRPTCEFVSVDQFYVPFNAPNLQRADRFTHVIYRSSNDLKRDIAADMYRECDLGEPNSQERSDISTKMDEILGFSYDPSSDPQYCLLEQHCYLELGGDFETPVAAPYVVTIDEDSKKCLSIRRNWEEDDPQYIRLEHFVHYQFVPGFGFYGFGYIHFLGNLTLTATAAMRALIDAGQFANLPGGFKARGVRIVGDQDPIGPGEWREVESTGQQLDKSFYALPYKEPSQTLYNMLDFVTRAGQKFADTTEQIIADSSNYGPVGTTMALIEQSAKFFTAIHKRLHKSQRDEFRVLARVNYEFLPTTMGMDVADGSIEIFKEDFDGRIDVLPVSDPNIPSATHRLALAQMALQLSSQAPQGTYDVREVHKMILESSNIENVDRLMPPPHKPKPQSPMADIISVSQGQPIKAFPEQNHQAHITFKNAFLNNPAQQQNPAFPQMAPLIQANISEHMLLQYQEEMMAMVGQDASADEFAQAQAAQQLTQMAQMAAIGQQQGSVEQQSLELQKGDLQLRAQEAQVDATQKAAKIVLDNRKLDIEEQRVQNLAMKEGATLGYNAMKDVEDRKTKMIIEYAKFVAALAKDMEITFSKDSELFKVFPEAFKGAEGGEIQIKDAPTFYALQDKIMNYDEGGDVDRASEVESVKQATIDRMTELGIDPTSPSAMAEFMEKSPRGLEIWKENLPGRLGDPRLEEVEEVVGADVAQALVSPEVKVEEEVVVEDQYPAIMFREDLAKQEEDERIADATVPGVQPANVPMVDTGEGRGPEVGREERNWNYAIARKRAGELLNKHEGTKNTLHVDSKNKPTLGIGHLVTEDSFKLLEDLGVPQEVITKIRAGVKTIKEQIEKGDKPEDIDVGLSDEYRDALRDYHISEKRKVLQGKIHHLDFLPAELQAQLIQSAYRGGITASTDTIDFINAGEWEKAADEFLQHDEYLGYIKKGKTNSITDRMEALSAELRKMSELQEE